jgi:chromosome segregation ATPase
MSTRQSYDFLEAAAAEQRRAAEVQRRQMRLAQQRTAQAAADHRRQMEQLRIARAAERQMQENRQVAARAEARQRELGSRLDSLGARQAETDRQLAEARRSLDQLSQQAEASRRALLAARQAVEVELQRAARIEAEMGREAANLASAMADARNTLGEVHTLGQATVESLDELSPAEGEALQARQVELEAEIRKLEGEVRFLTQDEAVAPAALMTLLAMEANGYHLRETLSREGLVAYFARADEEHQIAVRSRAVAAGGRGAEGWEVVAETFGLTGEECLYELEDFETAVEDLSLGRLAPGRRIYPKGSPDRSVAPLPAPRRDLRTERKTRHQRTSERA